MWVGHLSHKDLTNSFGTMAMHTPDELSDIYRKQSDWFAGERNRLLRKAEIARRHRVLDLGTGTGELLANLDRRAAGFAVGVDADAEALRLAAGRRVVANAQVLPFPDATFDLVFTQMFFLWAKPLDRILEEIHRILTDDGYLIAAAEPDYGGAIEYPANSSQLSMFTEQLLSEGADLHVGRKLDGAMANAGFEVECGAHASQPLARESGAAFLYVPYFHFLARKRR
jgi:ubiquinone/menaquinone biosynthesis C-methylase UbiE